MKNTIEQNKITEYFLSNKGVWSKRRDGDLATKLFSQLDVKNDNPSLPFSHIAKKFFLRTVRCAIDKNFVNDSMLIIAGKSPTRKTTFLYSLVGSGDLFTFSSSSYAEDEIIAIKSSTFMINTPAGENPTFVYYKITIQNRKGFIIKIHYKCFESIVSLLDEILINHNNAVKQLEERKIREAEKRELEEIKKL